MKLIISYHTKDQERTTELEKKSLLDTTKDNDKSMK
jgi:hypothetical protein